MSDSEVQSDVGRKGGAAELAAQIRGRDMLAVEQAARRGYPCDPQGRAESIAVCRAVMNDPKSSRRTKLIAVRALAVLDSLQLRDAHHYEGMQHDDGILELRARRAEEGRPNDLIGVQLVPVERLPDPDWLAKKREKLLKPSES